MKITINSNTTNLASSVAYLLSSRLGLDLYTGITCDSIDLTQLSDDYIVSAVDAHIVLENTLNICLVSDLIVNKVAPITEWEHRKFLVKHCKDKYNIDDVFDSAHYDVYINVTGLRKADICQYIIQILVSGNYGYYMPAHLLLPCDVYEVEDVLLNTSTVFNVNKVFGSYFITDNIPQAIKHSHARKLLRVNVTTTREFNIMHKASYDKWEWDTNTDLTTAIHNLMLSLYCIVYECKSHEEAYIQLFLNGSPFVKLKELGFDIDTAFNRF